jgi:hypothetical protein
MNFSKEQTKLSERPSLDPPKDFSPLKASLEELTAYGYPARPDPESKPLEFTQWLELVRLKERASDLAGGGTGTGNP